jgi:hypothetical protein
MDSTRCYPLPNISRADAACEAALPSSVEDRLVRSGRNECSRYDEYRCPVSDAVVYTEAPFSIQFT